MNTRTDYDVYGFLLINDFLTNAPTSINSIGEISIKGRTYVKDILEYPNDDSTLLVFKRNGVSDAHLASAIDLSGILYKIVSDLTNRTTGTFEDRVYTSSTALLTNISYGVGVINNKNTISYPSSINFTYDGIVYHIWLANHYFETEYPFIELSFITCVDNLQELYSDFTKSKRTVESSAPMTLFTLAKTQVTHIVTGEDYLNVRVYNHINISSYFDLPVIIKYNGNPILATSATFMRALADKLVNEGIFTLDQWVIAIPTLVPINKFIIIPLWDNVAIGNVTLQAPICSPSVELNKVTAYTNKYLTELLPDFILTNLVLSVVLYKSIPFLAIQAITNPDVNLKFNDVLPDYCLMHPSDINIQQMSDETQILKTLLDRLIRAAEYFVTGNTGSLLSEGFNVAVKGNDAYITGTAIAVEFSVLTRNSMVK